MYPIELLVKYCLEIIMVTVSQKIMVKYLNTLSIIGPSNCAFSSLESIVYTPLLVLLTIIPNPKSKFSVL